MDSYDPVALSRQKLIQQYLGNQPQETTRETTETESAHKESPETKQQIKKRNQ
ncbi:hypothetical protein [Gloeobacter morelensis]|uniref:Uncharacterized protein n=1 Tax=Gloeobacter morelensis MG652769 TaxID=2781736 RepID=A0ABY3PH00_9CYAN|nr:hypothetical protein [Gloeobacter morelensis]UFP92915.1 hypothetical protein ISF26_13905 [Gloeobacter morelensis MG652769]